MDSLVVATPALNVVSKRERANQCRISPAPANKGMNEQRHTCAAVTGILEVAVHDVVRHRSPSTRPDIWTYVGPSFHTTRFVYSSLALRGAGSSNLPAMESSVPCQRSTSAQRMSTVPMRRRTCHWPPGATMAFDLSSEVSVESQASVELRFKRG